MLKDLAKSYKEMIEAGNFSEASSIAFKIAEVMSKNEKGWVSCTKDECQTWMELGYENALKAKNEH